MLCPTQNAMLHPPLQMVVSHLAVTPERTFTMRIGTTMHSSDQPPPQHSHPSKLPSTQQRQSPEGSQLVERPTITEVSKALVSCRTVAEAIKAPTFAMALSGGVSEEELMVLLQAKIVGYMQEYFSEQRAATPSHCALFAESIVDYYKHESAGDIPVFMKRAAMGKYDDPKEYGRIDFAKLSKWWRRYLDEKAQQWENERLGHKKPPIVELDSRVIEVMKGVGKEDPLDTGRRVFNLHRKLPHMTDDDMRKAWKGATIQEKSLLMQEANRRGLAVKKLQEHINKTTHKE